MYSLISTGTELMKVNESKMSLIGKAALEAGAGGEGARDRGAARTDERVSQGDEPSGFLHSPRLFAGRRGRRGRAGSRGVQGGPARRLRRQRVRTSRGAQLGPAQPLCRRSRRGDPAGGRVLHRRCDRHAGGPPRPGAARRHRLRDRPGSRSASWSCSCWSPPA